MIIVITVMAIIGCIACNALISSVTDMNREEEDDEI